MTVVAEIVGVMGVVDEREVEREVEEDMAPVPVPGYRQWDAEGRQGQTKVCPGASFRVHVSKFQSRGPYPDGFA